MLNLKQQHLEELEFAYKLYKIIKAYCLKNKIFPSDLHEIGAQLRAAIYGNVGSPRYVKLCKVKVNNLEKNVIRIIKGTRAHGIYLPPLDLSQLA